MSEIGKVDIKEDSIVESEESKATSSTNTTTASATNDNMDEEALIDFIAKQRGLRAREIFNEIFGLQSDDDDNDASVSSDDMCFLYVPPRRKGRPRKKKIPE